MSSKRIADHFASIHEAVCSISYLLEPEPRSKPGGFALVWPDLNPAPDPLQAPNANITAATKLLKPLIAPSAKSTTPATRTSVYPMLCLPKTLNNELPAIKCLLDRPVRSYTFTAGYFNPHPAVTASLIASCSAPVPASGLIITASPYANGFFGSKGISGMLPAAYTHLSSIFLRAARGKSIQLREWQRGIVGEADGWTYHAKGLWVTLASPPGNASAGGAPGPNATLIGSSNYTTRSYGLDLEVGATVVTNDERLMRKWKREEELLLKYTKLVTEEDLGTDERRASWKVRIAMWIVRIVGGAL